jgi:hypothetical protein
LVLEDEAKVIKKRRRGRKRERTRLMRVRAETALVAGEGSIVLPDVIFDVGYPAL